MANGELQGASFVGHIAAVFLEAVFAALHKGLVCSLGNGGVGGRSEHHQQINLIKVNCFL